MRPEVRTGLDRLLGVLALLAIILVATVGLVDREGRRSIETQAQRDSAATVWTAVAVVHDLSAPMSDDEIVAALGREFAAAPDPAVLHLFAPVQGRPVVVGADRHRLTPVALQVLSPESSGQGTMLMDTPSGPVQIAWASLSLEGEPVGRYVLARALATDLAEMGERTRGHLLTVGLGLAAVAAVGAVVLGLSQAVGRGQRRPSKDSGRSNAERGPIGAVVAEGFFSRLAFGIISFALPLYAYDLGMSLAQIGLLLSTNMAVAVVLKPLMGGLIDRMGVRTAYLVAVALRCIVLVLLVLAAGPALLFAARAVHGLSIALRDPASATVLSALGGKRAVAQRFAWYQTVKSFAGSGGQFGAGVLLTILVNDFTLVFVIAGVLSLLPLGLVLSRLRGPALEGLRLPRPETKVPMPTDLRRALLPYAGLGAMATGTAYLMANLLPVLAVEYMGLTAAAAGSMYLVKSLVSLTGPVWGWVADRVSVNLVLGVRALGNTVSSLIWLLFPGYAGLLLGRLADDLGKAAFAPAWGAVMAGVSELDPSRRSRTLAWLSSAEDAGEMAGPVVAGVIWSTFGLPALLIFRALLALATEVYAARLARSAGRVRVVQSER
ncbi:MFS transporter [Ornithinimicrobium sp. Y1847]|uniref:MFS transporter n=1 Tax=Ornithinimicrobium sp. Y1847 TaxID=3405419 RepID=UPI003B66B1AF